LVGADGLAIEEVLEGTCPLEVFARLVPALVFKTSGGLEKSPLWVRFPYTSDFFEFTQDREQR
jgi:hypothetical protein